MPSQRICQVKLIIPPFNGRVAAIEHLRRLCALDASLRTIIAESSFHAPVNQCGGSLSTRNADTVEQTPLRAPAHRGVDGAFSYDRRAKIHRTGYLVCFAWTHASRTEGDHESKRQNENAVHRNRHIIRYAKPMLVSDSPGT